MVKDEDYTTRRGRPRKTKEPILVETLLGVLSIIILMIGILIFFSAIHAGGSGGEVLFNGMESLVGIFVYLLPILLFYIAYYLWKEELPEFGVITFLGKLLFIFGIASLGTLLFGKGWGGYIGYTLSSPLENYFSIYPSFAILLGITLIGLIFSINRKPSLSHALEKATSLLSKIKIFFSMKKIKSFDDELEEGIKEVKDVLEEDVEEIEEEIEDFVDEEENRHPSLRNEIFGKKEITQTEKIKTNKPIILTKDFLPPPLDLLNYDMGKSGAGDSKTKMTTIQKTLEHFRINVEMGEVTVGPSVTQFTLKPAQGVNLSKIVALHDNLAMELGAEFLRIEAPIPGKTLVGVEIPNEKKSMLGLRSMLELPEFTNSGPLSVAIGKSIVGKPIFGDLEKMPHLLVAGATRTGKSVTLQNLLMSLLYKNSPHDLKLIILDPKRVEFTAYVNLPHLYTPIIKEPKSAIKALNWAIQEMERRYEVLSENGQVNVGEYNKKVLFPAIERAKKFKNEDTSKLPEKMPYVVIVFDEYNDFMLSYPKEISPLITALSQKGRAAGIHLILATQRPDVKVITGTIKANIPARIALKTTSQIDSRTILDSSGAEDLLGNGDMLYMASDNPRLLRLQAPFISMEEITAVVKWIKQANLDFVPDLIDIAKVKLKNITSGNVSENDGGEEPEDDEDYMSAKDYVISTGKASTSSLQTAFRWGYNKAARIMNDLERYEVIGPARQGGRYREILVGQSSHENEEDNDYNKEDEQDHTTDDIFK